jgi:hypothetical protein
MEGMITKFLKSLFKKSKGKEKTIFDKIKSIFGQMIIIICSVSISIWLHELSEKRHTRHEEATFLQGLKEDLTKDIAEMEEDKISYKEQNVAFTYLTNVGLNKEINADSLKKYNNQVFRTTGLVPNNGRFEGFKSSGKIGIIENKELQNDIMDLYQESIPMLLLSTNSYVENKEDMSVFLQKNLKRTTDSTTNLAILLQTDEGQNICLSMKNVDYILKRYDNCILKMKKIIQEIDKI